MILDKLSRLVTEVGVTRLAATTTTAVRTKLRRRRRTKRKTFRFTRRERDKEMRERGIRGGFHTKALRQWAAKERARSRAGPGTEWTCDFASFARSRLPDSMAYAASNA
jgi:hypothetical protein